MATTLSQEIAPHLPYLRRYARALSGSQASGDAHVVACLETIVADPQSFDGSNGSRVGLYRLFHILWNGLQLDAPLDGESESDVERTASERLAAISPERRQVLLLEDLQWVDASTIDLIAFLAHNLPAQHLVVLTRRSDEVTTELSRARIASSAAPTAWK